MKKKPCDIKLSSTCINNCKDPSDNVCNSTGTPGLVNHLWIKNDYNLMKLQSDVYKVAIYYTASPIKQAVIKVPMMSFLLF